MADISPQPPERALVVSRQFILEWGDCDPLGIIFYPTYFRWIDASSHALFRRTGHDIRTLKREFGVEGPVIVDVGAKFRRPVTYGDQIEALVWVGEWRERTFRLDHVFRCQGETICTGHELRAWTVADPDSANGLSAQPIPEAFRQLFATG